MKPFSSMSKRLKVAKDPPVAVKLDKNGFRIRPSKQDDDVKVTYTFQNGLRKVVPYNYTYKTFCKKRWREHNILDVFTTEFRDKSAEYYKKALDSKQVTVNDTVVGSNYILKDGDLIHHETHKHEPAVSAAPIRVVFENDNIMVVDKPSGMPAHPTGRYKYNSVVNILKNEKGITTHPCNRLDRLTSGIMFLAKTSIGSKIMFEQLTKRNVEKWYIARVKGKFPLTPVTVDQPLDTLDPKLTLNYVCKTGKPSKTLFSRLAYDPVSDTSIVECKPLTGRSHQIRVHLQYIGHPIANDPLYSSPKIWGPNLGKLGEADFDEIRAKLGEVGKEKLASSWIRPNQSLGELLKDEKCPVCDNELYSDPEVEDLQIWLHAYRYETENFDGTIDTESFSKWGFRTRFPDWALDPFRKYMELALQEAHKCPPTTTAFSVGAVLFNDTILSTGYSRELPGNTHAEQNAFTKYTEAHGEKPPKGTVLFTTMEPCSTRLSGNKPCVDRVLDLGTISTVFVGVSEPDTFVKKNVCQEKLRNAGIEYIYMEGYEDEILKAAKKGHHADHVDA